MVVDSGYKMVASVRIVRESRLVKLRRSARFATLAVLLASTSCVRVKPFERQTHARPAMQDPSATEVKLDEHVKEYREGSIGGSGVGGGGCGCN